MKSHIAVMQATADNRVAKYQDFDTKPVAQAHVAAHLANYPNAFVAPKPNDTFSSWLIDPGAKTLSIDFPVIVPPTNEERIDAAFPQTDTARVLFEYLFELTNRVIAREGGTALTRTQFKTRLKAKLP